MIIFSMLEISVRLSFAEIGEYIIMVRKDRHGDEWFPGSLTNEKPGEFDVSLIRLSDFFHYKPMLLKQHSCKKNTITSL